MRIARWMTKATDKHSEYLTLTAFPLQQWLQERVSVLRLYIQSLSFVVSCEAVAKRGLWLLIH